MRKNSWQGDTDMRSFHDYKMEKLRDPARAARFLKACWEESPELLLNALEDITQAQRQPPGLEGMTTVLATLAPSLTAHR